MFNRCSYCKSWLNDETYYNPYICDLELCRNCYNNLNEKEKGNYKKTSFKKIKK